MNSKTTTSEEKLIQMAKITNVLESASMGVWRITISKDGKREMNATKMMLRLLGFDPNKEVTDEEVFKRWYDGIFPEALQSVEDSMAAMIRGKRSENTYKWMHPTLGRRYVRCGTRGGRRHKSVRRLPLRCDRCGVARQTQPHRGGRFR